MMLNKKMRKFNRIPAFVLAVSLLLSSTFSLCSPLNLSVYGDSLDGVDSVTDSLAPTDSGIGAHGKMARATITITQEDDLKTTFPDKNFRAIVFPAVKGLSGPTLEDALMQFTGTIKASGRNKSHDQKIADIRGLNLLRHAESVDLSYNEIRDFSALSRSGSFSDTHYGALPTDALPASNVEWDLRGNPFAQLPATFGGLLVIKQPGTTSYTYPDEPTQIFLRTAAGQSFSTKLSLARCRIKDTSADNAYTENGYVTMSGAPSIVSASTTRADLKNYSNPSRTTNTKVELGNILTTGRLLLAVPVDQVIHYQTTDEYGTVTPGSQSFKYYIPQPVEVYDKITMTHEGFTGGFTFTKTNTAGQSLAGAIFDLYYGGELVESDLTTDADGKIDRTGLRAGSYTLRENHAPNGYVLGDDIDFAIGKDAPILVMSGGVSSVTPTDGSKETSSEGMRLVKGASTPPISMAFRSGVSHEKIKGSITITYSSLNGGAGMTRFFPESNRTIELAVNDLNSRLGDITGPVTVAVKYEGADASDELGEMHPEFTKSNALLPPAWSTIEVKKSWKGDDDTTRDRPASVHFRLLCNGIETGDTVTLNDGNSWQASFSGSFDAADAKGKPYKYTVEEEEHLYYNTDIEMDVSGTTMTFTATNTSLLTPPPPNPHGPTDDPPPPSSGNGGSDDSPDEPKRLLPPKRPRNFKPGEPGNPGKPVEPDKPSEPGDGQPSESVSPDALAKTIPSTGRSEVVDSARVVSALCISHAMIALLHGI